MTKRFMIEQLYEKWNVTPPSTLNEFTGYESVYPVSYTHLTLPTKA